MRDMAPPKPPTSIGSNRRGRREMHSSYRVYNRAVSCIGHDVHLAASLRGTSRASSVDSRIDADVKTYIEHRKGSIYFRGSRRFVRRSQRTRQDIGDASAANRRDGPRRRARGDSLAPRARRRLSRVPCPELATSSATDWPPGLRKAVVAAHVRRAKKRPLAHMDVCPSIVTLLLAAATWPLPGCGTRPRYRRARLSPPVRGTAAQRSRSAWPPP